MNQVEECLIGVTLGKATIFRNLTMFPLQANNPWEADYDLLDEALADGSARVTEVSESGSVPELRFECHGEKPVLLLDGEELVGAKQNRILNLTILASAGKSVVIPVSCVEAGRWQSRSREFTSASRAHFAEGRAKKAESVSYRMYADGSRVADQSQVWDDISLKSERMHAYSQSQASEALYDTHRGSLDAFRSAFSSTEADSGAVFAINGEVVGMDLFDCPATFSKLMPKIVESYALDALDALDSRQQEAGPEDGKSTEQVEAFMDSVAKAPFMSLKAIGEGEDLRLRGNNLSGGALYANGRIIHLCAFQLRNPNGRNNGAEESRERRTARLASLHRRRHSRD